MCDDKICLFKLQPKQLTTSHFPHTSQVSAPCHRKAPLLWCSQLEADWVFCSVFINKPCGKCCPSERSLSQLPFFANCSCSLMVMPNPSGLHHKQQVYTFIPHFIYHLLFLKYLIVEILACRLKVLSLLFWPDGENVTEEQQTVILHCIPLSLLSLKDLCLLSVCLLLYRRCKKSHFSRTLIMHSAVLERRSQGKFVETIYECNITPLHITLISVRRFYCVCCSHSSL